MQIKKHLEKNVLLDSFFTVGYVDLDADYFINSIKQNCSSGKNLNYITNIKGSMTSWQTYTQDSKFIAIIKPLIKYVDSLTDFPPYRMEEAWGFELKRNEKTNYHSHNKSLWSGAIYLNSSSQFLNFPQIEEKVKPEKGKFVIFSSFLTHGCEKNEDDFSKFGLSFNMNEYNKKFDNFGKPNNL
tara:strand:+ start:361 stop:912 length:552 start_codon:yes stop_codon:yes gene_type:complete